MWTLNADGVYQSSLLASLPWVVHGFGTRAAANWPGTYTQLKQIHSNVVLSADSRTGVLGEGDALVTRSAAAPIGIRTADCVPILIVASDVRAVAAIHAGWRGTDVEIASVTVEKMTQEYGADPKHMLAAIGPSIAQCCFAVKCDVADRFRKWFPEERELSHVNLVQVNRDQLLRSGLSPENLDIAGLCTSCRADLFHSFRRDRELAGRMVAAIGIRNEKREP